MRKLTLDNLRTISRTTSRLGGDGKLNHSSNLIYKYLY